MRIDRDTLVPLVLAILAGAISWIGLGFITRTQDVVVATRDLDPLTRVDVASIKVKAVPVEAVHPKAFRKVEDVAGKRSLGPISQGQQITVDQVADPNHGLRRWTATGSVIMFMPMPPSQWVGGSVQAGDTVDLIYCANESKTGISVSRVIAAAVPVVGAVGPGAKRWDASPETLGLHLVLSPADAEKMVLCLETGTVYACLSGRQATSQSWGANLEDVTGIPKPPARGVYTR